MNNRLTQERLDRILKEWPNHEKLTQDEMDCILEEWPIEIDFLHGSIPNRPHQFVFTRDVEASCVFWDKDPEGNERKDVGDKDDKILMKEGEVICGNLENITGHTIFLKGTFRGRNVDPDGEMISVPMNSYKILGVPKEVEIAHDQWFLENVEQWA